MSASVSHRRIWLARGLALVADLVQVVALPLFGAGLASPIDEILDLAIGAAMIALVGWHVAFLPTFLVEVIPFVDMFPTWTAAVFFATRGRGKGREVGAGRGSGGSGENGGSDGEPASRV